MSRKRWVKRFATLGVVVLALVQAGAVAAAGAQVAAVDYEFDPSSLTVSIGDTVVWKMSGEGHTVRSGTIGADNLGHPSDGPLDSGFRGPGESYSFTFAEAGTYEYFCEIHPEQMKGTITVVGAANASAPAASAPSAQVPSAPVSGNPASAAATSAATPAGSGFDRSPAASATPWLLGGIVLAIALGGLALAVGRRSR